MSEEQIAAYFGRPTPLYLPVPGDPPAPPLAQRRTRPGLRPGRLLGHAEGVVGDVKTISSVPEGLMDIKVRHGVRVARFRPRFDGDNAGGDAGPELSSHVHLLPANRNLPAIPRARRAKRPLAERLDRAEGGRGLARSRTAAPQAEDCASPARLIGADQLFISPRSSTDRRLERWQTMRM